MDLLPLRRTDFGNTGCGLSDKFLEHGQGIKGDRGDGFSASHMLDARDPVLWIGGPIMDEHHASKSGVKVDADIGLASIDGGIQRLTGEIDRCTVLGGLDA